ncbi:uncharacterized protein BX664DRAFT_337885 [Halteromyces radiatus]|uniref:uncharacterized protein n=1 Tax=Halteromyces radiatus TaxID=101107 RepID=UPI002220687C|nr:uncharacterized protein BX664DRAFT_337885 [Halteromyces radiatus]KAI8084827.1 hypothetical protein BX664DRAFT_337885 [Halteromyces radiatus]
MYPFDDIFSQTSVRKPPLITYKRKQQKQVQHYTLDQTPLNHDSDLENNATSLVTEKTLEPTTPEKAQPIDNVFDVAFLNRTSLQTTDIFDFPDQDIDDAQVELRIASSLHIKHKPQVKKSTTTASTNSKKKSRPTSTKRERVSSFSRTVSAPSSSTFMTDNSTASPTLSTTPVTNKRIHRLPDMKKKKRNLVSQLKGANGECLGTHTQTTGLRFYDISDDEDDTTLSTPVSLSLPTLLPSTSSSLSSPLTTTNSPTSFLDYKDRMEQELAELMRTEFGQDAPHILSSSSTSTDIATVPTTQAMAGKQQTSYVPENAIRTPITYKKRQTNKLSHSSNLSPCSETEGLDQQMEKQIQYLLSSDF